MIKWEEFGVVFCYMYDVVEVGNMFLIKVFGGKFYFNGYGVNSVVLIFGGVGIILMMSVVCYLMMMCWDGDIYFLFCMWMFNDFIFE